MSHATFGERISVAADTPRPTSATSAPRPGGRSPWGGRALGPGRRPCSGSKRSTTGGSRLSAIDMLSPVDYEERYWDRRAAAQLEMSTRPGQDQRGGTLVAGCPGSH